MFSKEIFAQRLAALRTESGQSQKAIANYLNVARTTVTMMETGQRAPSIEVAYMLADYFHVSLDYLCGRSDNSNIN